MTPEAVEALATALRGAMSVRVMVTIQVRRGAGPWDSARTLTLAGPDDLAVTDEWLREFLRLMARALAAAPEPDAEDEE